MRRFPEWRGSLLREVSSLGVVVGVASGIGPQPASTAEKNDHHDNRRHTARSLS